ncbi:MAG: arginine--tRNA ligase [Chloroflexota bacterium]|nr:arginine--tRNA ligase [Chloroflexota bacterium]
MARATRDLVGELVRNALELAQADQALPPIPPIELRIERPKEREHGDYSCNVALRLASAVRMPPMEVASAIAQRIMRTEPIADVDVARPGFINITLDADWQRNRLLTVIDAGDQWGRVDLGAGHRVQVEFVSANPTGPLQVGNGRGAVLGDALASVLDAAGFEVQREYYVNDAGAQIRLFGRTLFARYQQQFGREVPLPEGGYQGAYMVDVAGQLKEESGDRWLESSEDPPAELSERGLQLMVEQIRGDLVMLRVEFDHWQRESTLYDQGDGADSESTYDIAMSRLRDGSFVIEKEGAVWFRSDALGEDKDNVLIRSSGEPTYFASDVAYHYDKFLTRGFDTVIDVWGADHQGHVARTQAAVSAVGGDGEALEVLLYQLVHLRRGDERVRMSKRTGEIVTLRELIEEVGSDAARFFMLQRSADAQMDFDLAAAASADPRQNPASYVKYAHARCASVLRNAGEAGLAPSSDHLDLLVEEQESVLIGEILRLPELVADMATRREPHHLTYYAQSLAQAFTQFYDAHRIVVPDEPERSGARLTLTCASRAALAATLRLIGVDAPNEM